LSNPALINDDSKCIFTKTRIKKQIDVQTKPKNIVLLMEATAYTRSAEEETIDGITRTS
jgi:hypothetical protein